MRLFKDFLFTVFVITLIAIALFLISPLAIKGATMYIDYVFPDNKEPDGFRVPYLGQGELKHKLFSECMILASGHQDKASTLSTVESETSELVDECSYYANSAAKLILKSSTPKGLSND